MTDEPIIVSTPGYCCGEPRINGTRISAATIQGYVKAGMSLEEIHHQFAYVSREAIQAAIDYALPPEVKAKKPPRKRVAREGTIGTFNSEQWPAGAAQQIADLTAERDSLTVQLDSCQGALREVIAENTANCDRAEKMERKFELAAEQNYCTICGNTLDGYEGDKTRQRAENAEAALAEARQHIAHLEDQLADAETARTLALGIAERAEQALIDRTGAPE